MTDSNFLPDDYEAPSGGGSYMKLQQGENRIRILSSPILGWEGWKDKTPYRFRMEERPVTTDFDGQKTKHFWAFICWDYADDSVKILEITQATIQKHIESLARDKDWGVPFEYDLKIVRKGEGLETEYSVNPVPHSPVTKEMKEALIAKPIRLEALYDSEDPFDVQPEDVNDDLPF